MPRHHAFLFSVPEALARPPLGLDFVTKTYAADTSADQERLCTELLAEGFSSMDAATRQMHTLGEGVGVALEESAYCHFRERDGVWAVFAGEVSVWPGHDTVAEAHDAFMRGEEPPVQSDAEWLLDFHRSFSMHANASDITEAALSALSRVVGPFSFVVYDATNKRVWAGRDAEGAQPLYWGVTNDDQLVFSTDAGHLEACNPSATPFPAGTLYASSGTALAVNPGEEGWVIQGEQRAGTLLSFVESSSPRPGHHWRDIKAIPRIKSSGVICGAVYKVASEQQFADIRGF